MRRISALFLIAMGVASARAGGPGLPPVPCVYGQQRLCTEMGRLISAHYRLDGDVQIDLVRPWSPPSRTAVLWQIAVGEFPPSPGPLMLIRCRLVADGDPLAETSLLVRAALNREVWFARQPIPSGSTFNPALMDIRTADCFQARDALPATAGDRSYIFSHDIAPDHTITWHDLARRPLVRKGDLVEATAREGDLYVAMKAQALENGARGDIINLRNLESHKEITAQVIDDDQVEIRF